MERDKFFIPFIVALSLFLITATTLAIIFIKTKEVEQETSAKVGDNVNNRTDPTIKGLGRIPEYLNLKREQLLLYENYSNDYRTKMEGIQRLDVKLSNQFIDLLFSSASPDSAEIEKIADSSAYVLKLRRMAAYSFMKSMLDVCDSTQKTKLKSLFFNLQNREQGKGFGRNRYRHGRPN